MESLQETKGFKKRFGNVAIEKGFITIDQLCEALAVQAKEEAEKGQHHLVGAILYKQGVMNFDQIDIVLRAISSVTPI